MKTPWNVYLIASVLSLYLVSCSAGVVDSSLRPRKTLKLGLAGAQVSPTRPKRRQLNSSNRVDSRTPPDAHQAPSVRSFVALPDVSVTCAASDFVVRVKPSFYGLEADASELKLGRTCTSNGVLAPQGDMLFTYPLTACDSTREITPGYIIYKFQLHYEPSPLRFPLRTRPVQVEVECHYQRDHHVYQLTVQPTWETIVLKKGLSGSPNDFKMELMDESWSQATQTQVYQPGETVHIQVSAPQMPPGGKLYIRNCFATPSTDASSSKKYTIIDNFGCLQDSKRDLRASQFVSRTDDTLRFTLKAFQFISSPDTEMSIHCHLFATSDEPGPSQKSCSYVSDRWAALRGDDSICQCCDSHCITYKTSKDMIEGSASSELLVSDEPLSEAEGFIEVRQRGGDRNNQETHKRGLVVEPITWREWSRSEGSGLGGGVKSWSQVDSEVQLPDWNNNLTRKKSHSRGNGARINTHEEHRNNGDDPEMTWYFTWK